MAGPDALRQGAAGPGGTGVSRPIPVMVPLVKAM